MQVDGGTLALSDRTLLRGNLAPVGGTYLLSALGPPLQRIRKCFEEGGADYDCEADVDLERALKAKMISTEVLLRKASRGGKRGRMAVSARLPSG